MLERVFIGKLTKHGKKSRAQTIFYTVMARLAKRYKCSVNDVLIRIFDILAPALTFTMIKKGATNYPHPRRIKDKQAQSLVAQWVIKTAEGRSENNVIFRLEAEIIDVLSRKGKAISKKLEFQRRAVSSRFVLRNVWERKRRSRYYESVQYSTEQLSKFVDSFEVYKKKVKGNLGLR